MASSERRVLSIQSHVVFGYVGNKAAVLPLQLHGFDVLPLNTVSFATHTGYGRPPVGERLPPDGVAALVAGLRDAGALAVTTHVLSGYQASARALLAVAGAVAEVREGNPAAVYVCDPVLGDDGRLYVPPELVDVYRQSIVPLASVLTPNAFEAETLTGVRVDSEAAGGAAMRALLAMGARAVVVTSTDLAEPGAPGETMLLLAACPWEDVEDECAPGGIFHGAARAPAGAPPSARGASAAFAVPMPRLPARFTGTGDLMAALLLAAADAHPANFVRACEVAVASLRAVCAATLARRDRLAAAAAAAPAGSALARLAERGAPAAFLELALVEARSSLVAPAVPPDGRARPLRE